MLISKWYYILFLDAIMMVGGSYDHSSAACLRCISKAGTQIV